MYALRSLFIHIVSGAHYNVNCTIMLRQCFIRMNAAEASAAAAAVSRRSQMN